jgi:signal transduction histidine kinase
MYDPLFKYYLIRFGILGIVLVCGAVAAGYWFLRRRWQRKQRALEQTLADCQSANYQKLYGDLQRTVSHEYTKGLDYILNKSSETREGLGKEQTALRDKQDGIIAKAEELKQHAMNILYVFALQPGKLKKELLNIRQLVQRVLQELYHYAESKGVILLLTLEDIEPIILDRDLTSLPVRNLIHNAIKYSHKDGVVEVSLTVVEDVTRPGKTVVITVKDHGVGIADADKERLFELDMRGGGHIEPGHGLGLYLARKAARLQGGDVILVSSILNQGSVFELSLPFASAGEAVQETEAGSPRRTRAAWLWGVGIAAALAAAALLFYIFKPPPQVAIVTYHPKSDNQTEIRYFSAKGEDTGWMIKQELTKGDCEKFTLFHLSGDKVALRTCSGRYVTAPSKGAERSDWVLWHDSGLSDCGQFEMLDLPDDPARTGNKVAFKTCADRYFTPGNDTWPGLEWSVVAETDKIQAWEEFTLLPQR